MPVRGSAQIKGARRHIISRSAVFVALRQTWLGAKNEIVIQATRLEPLAAVPGMSQGRLVLAVDLADTAAAQKLVSDLGLTGPMPAKPQGVATDLN